MKKRTYLLVFSLLLLVSLVSSKIIVSEFHSPSCPHCLNVINSGVLDEIKLMDNVEFHMYDVALPRDYAKYEEYHKRIKMPSGWPLLIVEDGDKINYLLGDTPIIENSKQMIENISSYIHEENTLDKTKNYIENIFKDSVGEDGKLSLKGIFVLVLAAVVDSINPCAFGVLLFLMISLLNLGSSKRALKAGMLYVLIVFIVYFLAGLGFFSIIQSFSSIRYWIYLVVGIIVLVMSIIEFRDYIMATKGRESILRITPKIKPFIEKYSKKGTIFAVLVLGVVVSLFELPCTGGVYIAIIAMLSKHVSASYLYLLIYNLIFVLPLIIITVLIYKGASPEKLQNWNTRDRKWMKLGVALVMLFLAIYLLWEPLKYFFR